MATIASSRNPEKANIFYTPLRSTDGGEIRVIDLLPGDASAQICLDLRTIALNSQSDRWDALSHCWEGEVLPFGPPVSWAKKIICNGESLQINPILHSALVSLRQRVKGERLSIWIDTICINQADNTEKAYQVGLMRQIYSRAQRVYVWLGNPTWGEETAFAFAKELCQVASSQIAKYGEVVHWRLENISQEQRDSLGLDVITPKKVSAFSRLLERKWFTRAWVIQEFAVASEVIFICGSLDMDALQFSTALHLAYSIGLLGNLPWAFYDRPTTLCAIREEIQRGVKEPLLNVLRRFRRFEATDKRDKVFAVQGLASDIGTTETDINLPIDYNLQTAQLFKSIAVKLAERYRNLDFLTAAGMQSSLYTTYLRFSDQLPSWVPNWADKDERERQWDAAQHLEAISWSMDYTPRPLDYDPYFRQPHTWYRASKDSVFEPRFENDSLIASGLVHDQIKEIGPVLEIMHSDNFQLDRDSRMTQILGTLIDWRARIRKHSHKKYPRVASMDVFWQILVGGTAPGDSNRFQDLKKCFHSWWAKACPQDACENPLVESSFDPRLNFLERAGISVGKRLLITKAGYIGIGPARSDVGDSITILEGGKLPFVLTGRRRRKLWVFNKPDDDAWRLLGASYIHGCMLGEVYKKSRCKKIIIS